MIPLPLDPQWGQPAENLFVFLFEVLSAIEILLSFLSKISR
jgi:hypothetical protein